MPRDPSQRPQFLKLRFESEGFSIGQRVKKGVFRPCLETLPTSTLMGCFKQHFGLQDAVAIGFLDADSYTKQLLTYAPFDANLGVAKLPLALEYLAPRSRARGVEGYVYVVSTEDTRKVFASRTVHEVLLGGFRSKGLGRCRLQFEDEVIPPRKVGYLRSRFRESDAAALGVNLTKHVIRAVRGYLFRPDVLRIGGVYERSLLEGSILDAPEVLLGEEYRHDR